MAVTRHASAGAETGVLALTGAALALTIWSGLNGTPLSTRDYARRGLRRAEEVHAALLASGALVGAAALAMATAYKRSPLPALVTAATGAALFVAYQAARGRGLATTASVPDDPAAVGVTERVWQLKRLGLAARSRGIKTRTE